MFSIVLIGTMIGVAARQMTTVAKRERETELLFRGMAIRHGIELYYRTSRAGFSQYPRTLEELVRDPGVPGVRRYLRKVYADPITGGEWVLIRDGSGRVKGVRTSSDEEPLKTANFPEVLKSFEGKKKYSEWVFEYNPQQAAIIPPAAPAPKTSGGSQSPFLSSPAPSSPPVSPDSPPPS
ncbi:MAG: type II secretion system protein [Nitrospirae bacterium]|nr:type II secretion system protein [Candidatus Manganitrophaceae bacterium]